MLARKDSNASGSGPLSSMKRSFTKTASTRSLERDDDQLDEAEWPATQPVSKKPSSTAATAVSTSTGLNRASSLPSGPAKSFFGQPASSKNAASSNAHWANKAAPPPAFLGNSKSHLAPKTASANLSAASSAKLQPPAKKKRTFPWDLMEGPPGKKSRPGPAQETGAFHKLQVPTTASSSSTAARLGSIDDNDASGAAASRSRSASPSLMSNNLKIDQKLMLSSEQQKVLRLVVEQGKSVFFTGSAGTGKSVLLREIIRSLKRKFPRPEGVAITASTGMAACNIGGTTIHSFAGIGLGKEPVDQLVNKIKKNPKSRSRWQRVQVLVIDEVSMVDGELFDKLAGIAESMRGKAGASKPFGGIQLIVTGDFFQLPPVAKGSNASKFAFEAKEWKSCINHTVNLTQVFRQKETEFVDMLNEMRFGRLSLKSIQRFRGLSRKPAYPADGIEPTELFARREEVDRANEQRLRALPGEARMFGSDDTGEAENQERARLLENMMAPRDLRLKIGAQVMLIKNKDETLVNGSTGKVVRFAPAGAAVYEDSDEEDGGETWNTLPSAKEQQPAGGAPKMSALAAEFSAGGPAMKKTAMKATEEVPWVEWALPDGRTSPPEPIAREEFKVEQGDRVRARRKQFPLMLAWAVSIHKSQGQTLRRVKVDLGKVFEAGQSYVALSRATSIDSLQVLGFDDKKVRCHPKVIKWAETLETFA